MSRTLPRPEKARPMTRHDAVPLLHDYLTHAARRAGGKIALSCNGRGHTYRELDDRANALAHTLLRCGVQRGDRIMVFMDNSAEAVIAFWAALKASGVITLINPLTRRERLAWLAADCRPAALIAPADTWRIWGEAARQASLRTVIVTGTLPASQASQVPGLLAWNDAIAGEAAAAPARQAIENDLAAIIYTSGSTGDPKGVMLSHRNMLTAATSISSYLGLRQDDVIVNALPLAFDYGLYQMILSVRSVARLVLERGFSFPAGVLDTMQREGVTVFPGVPTMFAMLAGMQSLSGFDLSRLRMVTNTAAALPVKQILTLRSLFPAARIFSMYGLTECKRCSYLPPEDLERKPTSVGIPIPNTEMWIIDEQGRRVGPNVIGQLVIRGATVMKGYWEKPEATAARLHPGPLPGELVLHTGDYCRIDEEGYLYFVARMDDIIKTRGEKVAPRQVEAVLHEIEGVREVAVIGVPDPLLGQAVKAYVVLEDGAEAGVRDLMRHCLNKLESFAVPRYIELVAGLPRTDTGKVSLRELLHPASRESLHTDTPSPSPFKPTPTSTPMSTSAPTSTPTSVPLSAMVTAPLAPSLSGECPGGLPVVVAQTGTGRSASTHPGAAA